MHCPNGAAAVGSSCVLPFPPFCQRRVMPIKLLLCTCRESLVVAADSGNDQQQVALRQTTLQLRLLRNCCALGAAAATLLLQHDVQQGVAAGAANVASSCCGTQQRQQQQCGSSSHAATPQLSDLLTAAVQFLHNLSATGPQGAAAVWSALFPAALDSLLLVDDGEQPRLQPLPTHTEGLPA